MRRRTWTAVGLALAAAGSRASPTDTTAETRPAFLGWAPTRPMG
jgi:hypothetical protein